MISLHSLWSSLSLLKFRAAPKQVFVVAVGWEAVAEADDAAAAEVGVAAVVWARVVEVAAVAATAKMGAAAVV
jgi:hypothetical protein